MTREREKVAVRFYNLKITAATLAVKPKYNV